MAKQRFIREGDRLDDDEVVVVRGGPIDIESVCRDAIRYHDVYGGFGISVFAARDITVDELAQRVPLVRFALLTLVRVGALRLAGFRLEATGRDPRHFTVAFDELDAGVASLVRCEQVRWENPYHEA